MELSFKQINGHYEAEFTAETDFNLHIERKDAPSFLAVYQRGSDTGEYARVNALGDVNGVRVFDYDFILGVAPKHIKVLVDQEPILAVVTFNE